MLFRSLPDRKKPRLLNLVFRNVGSDPFSTVAVHIARQNSRTRTEIKHGLSLDAKPSADDSVVKLLWVDVSVKCIVRGGFVPVEAFACVYVFVADFY